jgi:hypothetical protein
MSRVQSARKPHKTRTAEENSFTSSTSFASLLLCAFVSPWPHLQLCNLSPCNLALDVLLCAVNTSAIEPGPGAAAALDLKRHQRKCLICNHPDREAIEEEFLHWLDPEVIGKRYRVHRSSIYRHAHALGFFPRRAANIRAALELIIESAESVPVTGDTILRAVHAYTCLTDDGRWVKPPSHVVFSSTARALPPVVDDAARTLAPNSALPAGITGQDSTHSNEFLIATPTIRNHSNSLETKEGTSV